MGNTKVGPDRDSGDRAVKISFDNLENLDYRLRWVIGGLGLETAERMELEGAEEVLWDILNPREGRWPFKVVRMPLKVLEQIQGRLNRVMEGGFNGIQGREKEVLEQVRLVVEKILSQTRFQRAS
jgi:hypothetical protein